uniref:ATP synthase subunit a n=1 Tax=Sypharochiton pelliserpentis TaxID=256427 RepID=A0A059UAK1_9MOLL|nr:ATP synthase F0 subunit 6 [Sypharochiton pelliserpentis]AHZ60685.1 ATP synthase F0 subunit 6 [Sypharochiton pelliserpentis]
MLMDIFSSFDEQNFTILSSFPFIWTAGSLPLLILQSQYWLSSSRVLMMTLKPKSFMVTQILRTSGKNLNGFINIMSGIFVMLIFINILGLLPYVFSLSSHLTFAFSFGAPLWLSLILSGIFFNFSSVISHLLPQGAPVFLSPFLVLVETVSISVRPVTLSIRLVANMSAGHIILGLVGAYLSVSIFVYSFFIILMLIMVEIFYFMFEIGVSMIQAYIFSLLITLYSEDHPMYYT